MSRRSQSRIVRELPAELIEAINNKLVNEGLTYQEITDFLNEKGHNISRSSVGRYGKQFADRLERLKVIREQAKTIVETAEDRPMALAEGANQIAIQMIMETLLKIPNLDGEEPLKLIQALAAVERTGTMRERLKLAARRKADDTVKEINDKMAKNLSKEQLDYISEMVYGIVKD